MSHLKNSLRIGPLPVAVAMVAVASWMSGCGDDDKASGGGKGGSGATSGSAGSSTGGSAGTATGGSAGTATGGSAGTATGGSAGTAGMGAEGGEPGMGGEGGVGVGGEGGMGVGGEGGSTDPMCVSADLSFTHVSAAPMQQHTHLPVQGAARTTLVNLINSGMPLTFTMPEDGANAHTHTLTFTAPQLTVLRSGGALTMNITSSMGGPGMNMHTHTYSIECEP
jgi:hypothetical protein